jgi:hypothetical protein
MAHRHRTDLADVSAKLRADKALIKDLFDRNFSLRRALDGLEYFPEAPLTNNIADQKLSALHNKVREIQPKFLQLGQILVWTRGSHSD